ncbi:MAG: UDP-2,3-diacylglucosamine diphosphatase [Proteobacteria bacterium]|nr:UDP-2,3-diacylglucosamine diphosphatase [Pseudomonadota bacterium]
MKQPAQTEKAQPEPVALFISDLHLHESLPHTTQAFFDFLATRAIKAQRLYLLGDLFEFWAGDDDISTPYPQQVIDALKRVSDAGVALYWMAGNRDFLVNRRFAKATGAKLLSDPHNVTLVGKKLVLAHGDEQCTSDTAYMTWRAQVRQPDWQRTFLALPLGQRKSIIEGMRDRSRAANSQKSYEIMDVNADAIAALFRKSGASVMIHGHTHRPARHEYEESGKQLLRYVLPDWNCDVEPPRGGWIALETDGKIKRCGLDGGELD